MRKSISNVLETFDVSSLVEDAQHSSSNWWFVMTKTFPVDWLS
jgi:hypothetical protein